MNTILGTSQDWTKNAFKNSVGWIVLSVTAIVIIMLFFVKIPDENREVLIQCVGVLMGMGGTIVAYEFGSSKGAETKIPDTSKSVTITESKTETPKLETK